MHSDPRHPRPRRPRDRRREATARRHGAAARAIGIVVWLLPALLCLSCGEPGAATDRPVNVLLVTFDTTRADRLGCYGHAKAATPVVDGLAAGGVLFERCQTTAPITLPAHASVLTGLYPFRHGARNNGTHKVADDVVTLAELLAPHGYTSGAVVSALVLDGRFGLSQGFDVYDDDLSAGDNRDYEYQQTTADDTARRAIRFLEEHGEQPFFLWVHFYDPHRPFAPPEPWASRFGPKSHDGELAFVDHELGRILAALDAKGQTARTLVAVTADHGESFDEHGESGHGLFVYEATCHVPLVLHHASLPAGRRVRAITSVVDVAPTLLDLLGLPVPAGIDGVSLAPLLRGEAADADERMVYAEAMVPAFHHGWSDLRALTDAGGRYVAAPRPELYDHAVDPDELENRFAPDDPRARAFARTLEGLLANGERQGTRDELEEDAELRRGLAELGYVWSPAGATVGDPRLDPKDHVADFEALTEVRRLLSRDRPDKAERILAEVLDRAPGAAEPSSLLVQSWLAQQRFDEARELAARLVAGPTPRLEDCLNLAELDRRSGRADWDVPLRAAAERWPWATAPWIHLGRGLAEDGEVQAARTAFEHALGLDEHSTAARAGLEALR